MLKPYSRALNITSRLLNLCVKLRLWKLARRLLNIRKKHIATKLRKELNLQGMEKKSQQQMIDNIIDNFDFNRVMTTMDALNWRWSGSKDTPTKQELIDAASQKLHSAIEQVLSPDNKEHKNVGWICASGGFQAQAWKTKKGNLAKLQLEFIVSEWDVERD